MDNNIIIYINQLYKAHGWNEMINIIKSQIYNVRVPFVFKNSEFKNRIITIKYLEHNKIWKPKWTRQCRGIVMYLDDDDNIIPIKYLLQRGAEVLTNIHIKSDINDTQDIQLSDSKISNQILHLDDNQQKIVSKLLNGELIDGFLSFKCDGSLLGVTCYYGKYINIAKDWILKYGDDFSKLCLEMSLLNNCVVILSSQGTFFIGEDMQSYTVTSILASLGYKDIDITEIANKMTYLEALKEYGNKWFNNITEIFDKIKCTCCDTNIITLCFETICKNRTTAWKELHTELAISYNKSNMKFLGASFCGNNFIKFIPHFILNINNIFLEPLWWKISSTTEINLMLSDIELCIKGYITSQEYIKKYIPYNIDSYKDNDINIDYEGFVFYTPYLDGTNIEYDYHKIKSTTYYKAHNFKTKNIDYLLDISTSDVALSVFPVVYKIKSFFESLASKLIICVDKFSEELLKDVKNNKLYEGLNEKAKISFNKQNINVKYKMLINASNNFNDIIMQIFIEQFPELNKSTLEKQYICTNLKKIIMLYNSLLVENYKNVIALSIKNINDNNELKELFNHCQNIMCDVIE